MRGIITERVALPACLVLLVGGVLFGALYIAASANRLVGTVRPELSLRTLSGTTTRLPAPFFSRHIIILFTPSCSHCKKELDHFSTLVRTDPGIPCFGISLGDPMDTDSLVASLGVMFPIFLDENETIRQMWQVDQVPVTLFVDEQDLIRLALVGSRSFQEDSLLYARFSRAGAPGTPVVGDSEGMDIRQFSDAPAATLFELAKDAPSACLAEGVELPNGPGRSPGI